MSNRKKVIIVICVILLILAFFAASVITARDQLTNGGKPSVPAAFKLAGLNAVMGCLFLVMGRCVPKERKKTHYFLIGFGLWNALGGILGIVIAATMR